MQQILLILAFAAGITGRHVDLWKELRISNETLELFKKDLGVSDMKERFLKLRNLDSRTNVAKLTKEQEDELKERVSMMNKTPIEKPPGVNASSIVEINEQSGIANFLYEGDINLTEQQLNQLTESTNGDPKISGSRVKRGFAERSTPKWPNGRVVYYFDVNVTSNIAKAAAINAAIQYLQQRTCIRFVHWNGNIREWNRILFTHGEGCYSSVGMVGAEQIISIGDDCDAIGVVAHEIAHALGFHHTQSRPDRDQFITVDTKVIKPDRVDNFNTYTFAESIMYTPYEYGGMMQYPVNCFALNNTLFSMTPTDGNFLYTMGHEMISFYDIKMLNDHYRCKAKCPLAPSAKCQNGGLPNPNNCKICNCPLGYGGALCDQMPPASGGCGAELTATHYWQEQSFELGENTAILRTVFTECHHWIKAPADSQIEVRIKKMSNPRCMYGCKFNGIEFKLKNPQMTNPKICCVEFLNVTYTSELNPLPVIAHNRSKITKFTIEYKIGPLTQPTTVCPNTTCPPGTKKKGCSCVIV